MGMGGDGMAIRIAVVEDEERIGSLVAAYLTREGFLVDLVTDGNAAMEYLGTTVPDLIILDLMLPGVSGEEICQYVRQQGDTPIVMLTANAEEDAKVHGLELGADDYVTKPFSPRELTARVKSVLRRSHRLGTEPLRSADGQLVVDWEKHRIWLQGRAVNLTPTEFKLLAILARNPGRAFSRQELADRIFGLEYEGYEDSIYVHVKNLRQKLESGQGRKRIATVYGIGYRWEDEIHGSP